LKSSVLTSSKQVRKGSGNFSHWKGFKYPRKRNLHFPKPYQFAKSEKYEPFCVSKLLFWRQKMGRSHVVRRVSQGRIIVVLFWTKYAVPRQIQVNY